MGRCWTWGTPSPARGPLPPAAVPMLPSARGLFVACGGMSSGDGAPGHRRSERSQRTLIRFLDPQTGGISLVPSAHPKQMGQSSPRAPVGKWGRVSQEPPARRPSTERGVCLACSGPSRVGGGQEALGS